MTVSARLSLLFALAIMAMGVVAGMFTAQREYRIALEAVTGRTESRLAANPALQYFIYTRDSEKLNAALTEFFGDEAASMVLVFNGIGEALATASRPGSRNFRPADFALVRESMLAAEGGLQSFDSHSGAPTGSGLLRSLLDGGAPIYQSLPITTRVNSGVSGLTAADFAAAFTASPTASSRNVIGYLHLLLDRRALTSRALSAGGKVVLINTCLALGCGLLAWILTRRVTRPLRELAGMADAVAAGEVTRPLKVEGSGEIQDITRLFNTVIEGISDSRKVAEVDKRLLSLKVEERSSQLVARDQALNRIVEEANETRDQLHHLANYDRLTNLPNRNLLTEQLELLLKLNQRNGHTLALLFVDLDDFKRVNDSLGIGAGDQLLVEVGKRLSAEVRDSDSVARFSGGNTEIDVARLGGDEFTVVLNQLESAESARMVAERVLRSLSAPIAIEGHQLNLQPSIGVAIAPTDGRDVVGLLKAASAAKRHAKREGGNKIAFYHRDIGEAGEERLRLESDLRRAIESGELSLHYLPQVDTNSGSVVGAEALLRWQHPEQGQIPPGKLIGLAEDVGLIGVLGNWVLQEACRQLRHFTDEGVKLAKMAIKVSAEQFNADFARRVIAVTDEYKIGPGQLELALSEAIMTCKDPESIAALGHLREAGVYLSVDDFGTAYSPLSYLSQYSLDEIKIDRSFLLEADKSEAGANLLAGIIAMANELGLKVLASGVETESQFHFLTSHGTHLIQGYLLSKAVSPEALRPMLVPWHFVDRVQQLAAIAPGAARARAPVA